MRKLSLNKAAKEAAIAKSTLLDALNSGRMSAGKNDKGHWEIDPAELFRVFPKTSSTEQEEPTPTPIENREKTSSNSALAVEVKMLREQMDKLEQMHERDRQTLVDQIEDLKTAAERQSAEHMQALAVLTDQREKPAERRGWFTFGRKAG